MAKITCVVVPLDLGESSARTLDYAKTVAQPPGASLVLLHVVPNPYLTAASDVYLPPPQEFLDTLVSDARARLEEFANQLDRGALPVETVVEVGDPLLEIVAYATSRNNLDDVRELTEIAHAHKISTTTSTNRPCTTSQTSSIETRTRPTSVPRTTWPSTTPSTGSSTRSAQATRW